MSGHRIGPAGESALPVGTRLGEFEIRGIIGEGGFSIVYAAWDHSLQRFVAIKEYIPLELAIRDPAFRVTARSLRQRDTFDAGLKSFVNEARLLASFDHHSLVKVHRFWEDRGTAYMVMPWYQGRTLKETLALRDFKPSEAWLKRMLDPLTEALDVLHRANCFHRDVAPDNVLLVGQAQDPLLLDFGAARRVIGNLTHDLTAILKRGYAPLEQYGEIPDMRQGPWTDVYAVAAMLHFAIRGTTPPPAVARVVNDEYVRLSDARPAGYSHGFLLAIDRALAVRPEDRTASIAAFRQELGLRGRANEPGDDESSLRHRDAAAPPAGRGPAALSVGWRARSIALLSIGCVFGSAAYLLLGRHEAPTVVPASASVRAKPAPPSAAANPIAAPSTSAQSMAAQPTAPDRTARRQTDSAVADLKRLASSERRDVTPSLQAVLRKQKEADAQWQAGRAQQAAGSDREAADLAVRALNGLVDDLVQGYKKVADDAAAANEPEIARQATSRGRAVRALRR